MLVWASKFITAKIECSFEMGKNSFGGNIYFAGDDTINSKINGTPKVVYSPIPKLHSILAESNLLAHSNSNLWLYYYGQVNSLRLKQNVASEWASKQRWGYHLFCC